MDNKDIDDILKSFDDDNENNSHEGFNRSKLILFDFYKLIYRLFQK